MVLTKLRVFLEMMKGIGVMGPMFKQVKIFYRGNIIQTLKEAGWFDFLDQPRTLEELMENFRYTDKKFLTEVIDILVEDGVISLTDTVKYKTNRPVDETYVVPKAYGDVGKETWSSYAHAVPERLRGNFSEFSGGYNLYNWDELLSVKLYEVTRRCSFIFARARDRVGKFLDVGCGNGWGTSAIWSFYLNKGRFFPDTPMKVTGIDIDKNLLKIAREEFPRMVNKVLKPSRPKEQIQDFKAYFPEFIEGSATSIPFNDGSFDLVFASHILHWTNAPKAIEEMLRVCKPGGIVFGAQATYPFANRYADLHTRVIEGANGFFSKNDLLQWGTKFGAKTVGFMMPGFFKMSK